MESKFSSQFINIVKTVAEKSTNITDSKTLTNIIVETLKKSIPSIESKNI